MAKRNMRKVVDARWEKKEEIGRKVDNHHTHEIKPPASAKTAVQKEYLSALKTHQVVLFSAPAGVGKSYLTMCQVSDWLKAGVYDKIVMSRATIPMGRSLGMLPNDLRSKFEPYLMPLLEVLWGRYGKGFYETCLSNGNIELLAPEYARGRSIDGVLIIDEVQCMNPEELYTMLTRVSESGKLCLLGDRNQSDLKGQNGIDWLVNFVKNNPELQRHIKIIEATSDDIVRGGLCKDMVKSKERGGI